MDITHDVFEAHVAPRLSPTDLAALRLVSRGMSKAPPPEGPGQHLCACVASRGFVPHPDAWILAGHAGCGPGRVLTITEAHVAARGPDARLLLDCPLPPEAADRAGPWGTLAPFLAAQADTRPYNRFLGMWGEQPVPARDAFLIACALAGRDRPAISYPPIELNARGAAGRASMLLVRGVELLCRGGHPAGLSWFRGEMSPLEWPQGHRMDRTCAKRAGRLLVLTFPADLCMEAQPEFPWEGTPWPVGLCIGMPHRDGGGIDFGRVCTSPGNPLFPLRPETFARKAVEKNDLAAVRHLVRHWMNAIGCLSSFPVTNEASQLLHHLCTPRWSPRRSRSLESGTSDASDASDARGTSDASDASDASW